MIKGVVLSITASCLFGLVYYYPVLLQPLSVIDIFCWRLLMSFIAIFILIMLTNQFPAIIELFQRIKKQPKFVLGLLFSSFLLAIQMFIFVWAPLTGKSLAASLGYFLLPLVMVICGKLFYKEKLTLMQKIATSLATIGVLMEFYFNGEFSIETVIIAVGYPAYFMTRRKLKIEGIAGTFSDFFFIAIACASYFLINYDFQQLIMEFSHYHIMIPMLGIITAIAFAIYFIARSLLPFGLFGLLSYVEPVLLTFISVFFLHETISANHIVPYLFIWLAVTMLICEGSFFILRAVKRKTIR